MSSFQTCVAVLLCSCAWSVTNSLNVYRPPARDFSNTNVLDDSVPGIEYISRGYNIMYGNPHTTGNVDEGIAEPIFSVSNVSNGQTWNGHAVPNGVSILGASTCQEDFTYNAVTGANSYSSSLAQDTSFDAKVFKAAFSASVDYQSVYKETSSKNLVYTSTYTRCAVYSATINAPNDLPAFSENFYKTVEQMPNSYNSNNETNVQWFYDFFTKYFGTHYITEITMGGVFGTLSNMESFAYSKFSSSNLDIKTSASFSTIYASAAVSSMTDSQKQQAEDFNSVTNNTEIFNIGGNLPSNNDPSTWQQSLEAKPMPIYYKFDVIPSLLTTQYFPKVHDISKKQSALQSALNDYCSMVASNGDAGKIECSGYPPDPSLPQRSILKGFYASNVDGEPKNPYTNGYSCEDDFEPVEYAHWLDADMKAFSAYYCVNQTMNKHDQLRYFGGMYEMCVKPDDSSPVCNRDNYFTGKCDCPSGYTSFPVSDGFTDQYNSACPWNEYGKTTAETFLCYNASVPLSETIMAGFYSQNNDNSVCGPGWKNQYTQTYSCHTGFSSHEISSKCCCWSNSGTKCCGEDTTYVCLNNVYAT